MPKVIHADCLHFRPKGRHRHTWNYEPRSIGGWGIVRCKTCNHWDIY